MHLQPLSPKQSLNKAYLKEKVTRTEIESFKANLVEFLNNVNEKESEEYFKNLVTKFLYDTYYSSKNQINTKGRIDLAIYENSKPVVIIEAKRPGAAEMVTQKDLNKKALHELMLYYLQERVDHSNIDIKYLIITDTYQWFIFEASVFNSLFYQNKALMRDFTDWKTGRKESADRDLFYNHIAKPFLAKLNEEVKFTWFDLKKVAEVAKNKDPKDDKRLIDLFKILSPVHLLKQPFVNDSNSLDTKFYSELLHIIGLEEKKEKGKKIIQRKEKPDAGSLLENAINILESEDRLYRLPKDGADYGATKEERLFNIALELCITWINRILFLKLLEGQLSEYHNGDKSYRFLDFKTIPHYDELNKLFFQVLAQKTGDRKGSNIEKYANVPYLNSSLFEPNELERETIHINSLDDGLKINIASSTVLKTENGKKRTGELPTLQYLLEFLDAYDFASEGKEEIQEENKSIINASVLGLIFEKINGYKDGSFFTPGFITMYMCRETIRRAVVQKYNEAKGWKIEQFDQLYNQIKDAKEANDIINSLKICDPAVGSGHFLVSALNELIAIKSELGILTDRDGKVLRDYSVEVINDELIVSINHETFFEYKPGNKESQRVQEALFHEKQTLIENCLFGVDINNNSVKICRLRLWIELLKNAYYTAESKYTELETLPNIDINIKQGNSLISRFPLDADLSKALKKSKWDINSYKLAIHNYHHATSKDEKRQIERLIEDIKSNFETEIGNYSDPRKRRIAKLGELLYKLTGRGSDGTGIMLFEPTEPFGKNDEKTNKRKKEIEKIESEINKLAAEIDDIKNNAIYRDAFEWRFEFPEVLDNDGKYVGFDVVIGNPPWGLVVKREINKLNGTIYRSIRGKESDSYSVFVELGMNILSTGSRLSFIIPDSYLRKDDKSEFRKLLLDNYSIEEIIETGPTFTEVPDIWCSIIRIKRLKSNDNLIRHKKLSRFTVATRSRLEDFMAEKWDQNFQINASIWKDTGYVFGYLTDVKCQEIIRKMAIYQNIGASSFFSISRGEEGGKKKFIEQPKGDFYLVNPEYVYQYRVEPGIKIKSSLLALNKVKDFYTKPKIWCIRIQKLRWKQRIVCGLDERENSASLKTLQVLIDRESNLQRLRALQGILSSKLINFWCINFLSDDMNQSYLEKIPISTDTKIESEIASLVSGIIDQKRKSKDANTLKIEKQIDQLVYQLYGLTEDEIKIVEKS